jgi:hypothetical protein
VYTVATPKRLASAKYSGTMKLACRASSVWRSGTPSTCFGSMPKNAARSSGSKALLVGSCHTIGPSLGPSSAMPLLTKRSIDSPDSASERR